MKHVAMIQAVVDEIVDLLSGDLKAVPEALDPPTKHFIALYNSASGVDSPLLWSIALDRALLITLQCLPSFTQSA